MNTKKQKPKRKAKKKAAYPPKRGSFIGYKKVYVRVYWGGGDNNVRLIVKADGGR